MIQAEHLHLATRHKTRVKETRAQIEAHALSSSAMWPAVDASRLSFVRCMQGSTNMEASKFNGAQAPTPCAFPDLEHAMIEVQMPLWLPEAQVGMQPALLAGLTSALEMVKRITPDDKRPKLEPAFEVDAKPGKSEDDELSDGSDEGGGGGGGGGGAHAASFRRRTAHFIGASSKRRAFGPGEKGRKRAKTPPETPSAPHTGAISMQYVLYAGGFTPESIISALYGCTVGSEPPWGVNGNALKWVEYSVLRDIGPYGVSARIQWSEGVINRLIAASATTPGCADPLRAWLFHGFHTGQEIADREKILNVALRADPDPQIPNDCIDRYRHIRDCIAGKLAEAVDAAGGTYTRVLMTRLRSNPMPPLLNIPHMMDLYRELVSIEMRLSDLRTVRSMESGVDRVRRTRALEAARTMVLCAWKKHVEA